jgi:hypothetical protein
VPVIQCVSWISFSRVATSTVSPLASIMVPLSTTSSASSVHSPVWASAAHTPGKRISARMPWI